MKTMKKFLKYLILLIIAYCIVDLLVYFATKNSYRDLANYEILTNSPVIQITECKSAYSKGHISGTVTNDTGELIDNIYIKASFYDKNNIFLGTRYEEIKYFNATEDYKFHIEHSYKEVNRVEISLVSEAVDTTGSVIEDTLNWNEEKKKTFDELFPFVGLITLLYVVIP